MTIAQRMLAEMQQEGIATRKILAAVPMDKKDWQPHEKSMKVSVLARHLAEIQGWPKETVQMDVLDFAAMDYTPKPVNSSEELLEIFDREWKKQKRSSKPLRMKRWPNPGPCGMARSFISRCPKNRLCGPGC